MPNTRAGLRGIRGEGGWGVVCTGYCSIHPTTDAMPNRYARLWDEDDVRNLSLMTEAVHRHGALAGVELFYGASNTRNRYSREMPLSATGLPADRHLQRRTLTA
jgi:dimethylamine/trimethylamine dehydrogenase